MFVSLKMIQLQSVVCVLSLTERERPVEFVTFQAPRAPGVAQAPGRAWAWKLAFDPRFASAFPPRSVCALRLHFSLHSAEIIAHLGKSISNTSKQTRKEKGNFLRWSINLSLFC